LLAEALDRQFPRRTELTVAAHLAQREAQIFGEFPLTAERMRRLTR
jgi:hypothetical protein